MYIKHNWFDYWNIDVGQSVASMTWVYTAGEYSYSSKRVVVIIMIIIARINQSRQSPKFFRVVLITGSV